MEAGFNNLVLIATKPNEDNTVAFWDFGGVGGGDAFAAIGLLGQVPNQVARSVMGIDLMEDDEDEEEYAE